MSTAGKVLVVLILIASIACMTVAGAVAQLTYNGNQKLDQLSKELSKAQENVEQARREISSLRDQTTLAQEKLDRDVTSLRVQQTDLERTRSQVFATLERVKHELDTVKATIAGAKTSLQNRNAEFEAEEKAMDDLRRQVQSLKTNNNQLMARLDSLRKQFQDSYHANVGMLGKRQ